MKKTILTLLCLNALFLVSCGGQPTPAQSEPPAAESSISNPPAASSAFLEVNDSPVASGDYLQGSKVYRLDKESKKLKIIDFEGDYNKYKNNQGTLLNEYTIKFVQIGEDAVVYYEAGEGYYCLKQAGSHVNLVHVSGGSTSSSSISKFPTLIAPTYGNYVSTKAFTQYKVNEQGERITDSSGDYVEETFYLFLELSETSAKVFVGENNETHRAEPLHSIENYALRYNAGGTYIQIPHKDGEFKCSLTIRSASEIAFNNAYEKHGDYSAAGTFAIQAND